MLKAVLLNKLRNNIMHAYHGLIQIIDKFFILNAVYTIATPCGMISNRAYCGIANAKFTCKRSFWHTSHTHHGSAITFQSVDFSSRFQAWSLCCSIYAVINKRLANTQGSLLPLFTQIRTIWLSKVDMFNR